MSDYPLAPGAGDEAGAGPPAGAAPPPEASARAAPPHAARRTKAPDQLGQILISRGALTEDQLEQALEEQRESGGRKLLGEVLVALGLADEPTIMEALAQSYGVPYARITPRIADPRAIEALPREFIDANAVLPLFVIDDTITVAVSEPANLFLVEEIERLSKKRVQLVAATAQDIRSTLQAYLPTANVFVIDEIYEDVDVQEFSVVEAPSLDLGDVEEMSGQSPVVKLVNFLIYQAIHERASDIHIEPDDYRCRVRYRVDGRLVVKLSPPYQMHPAVVSRIKIMAGMDISERRVPQDGDIHVVIDGRPVDLRISTMPGRFGEKVVIRIIDTRNALIPIEKLGLSPEGAASWRRLIRIPHGMLLVSGPTGSGKSTTLYAALHEIASDDTNISTVENPIEAQIPGVNQFQTNAKAGFTFANALRALLRQDPDVIMVGEIRDGETALVATQAALTGHLVFSTIHTNDGISAVTRLINMGVEPYLVAAMLRASLAQRLVRKICPHCKEPAEPDQATLDAVRAELGECGELFHGPGCARCRGVGYAGRIGIFELFEPREAVLERIAANAPLQELRRLAGEAGHRSLRTDGLEKVAAGLTTYEEVVRAASF
jgi:type IV pilus assembly protein PilB